MHHDYFLMRGEKEPKNTYNRFCEDCTKQTVTVTSEVDQEVWVGAHVWQSMTYAKYDHCNYALEATHYFWEDGKCR